MYHKGNEGGTVKGYYQIKDVGQQKGMVFNKSLGKIIQFDWLTDVPLSNDKLRRPFSPCSLICTGTAGKS